jgi:predicted acetyltransferase
MDIGVPRLEDQDRVESLLRWAFDVPETGARRWIERAGLECWRVARQEGEPVACLLSVPMGHYFGGRNVPSRAICAVASAPEVRGAGFARRLLARTVEEAARDGVALASLFPSTRSLYRSVGFEAAGTYLRYRVPMNAFVGLHDGAHRVHELRVGDEHAVAALYEAQAARGNGPLERGAYFWSRVREVRGHEVRGFGFERDGALVAYVYMHTEKVGAAGPRYALTVRDLAWWDAAGARAVLAFLAQHGTLAEHVTWVGGPADPLIQLLPHVGYDADMPLGHWMVRILDVQRAFEARGYPAGVEATIDLELTDELVAPNNGRFVVEVQQRRAVVRRGGEGRLKLDVRALAPLYTGLHSPETLRDLGVLEGDNAALDAATAAFAGSTPWVRDAW